MIYPSGAGADLGTTEFILADGTRKIVEGGKGTWAIFENTLRQHRALAGQIEKPRPTIEIPVNPRFSD